MKIEEVVQNTAKLISHIKASRHTYLQGLADLGQLKRLCEEEGNHDAISATNDMIASGEQIVCSLSDLADNVKDELDRTVKQHKERLPTLMKRHEERQAKEGEGASAVEENAIGLRLRAERGERRMRELNSKPTLGLRPLG